MRATVAELLEATGGSLLQGEPNTVVTGVTTDSRAAAPGQLFVALVGERFDGHGFVRSAVEAGAVAAVVSRPPEGVAGAVPLLLVRDTVAAYGAIAGWWRSRMPAAVVAVTGSNGKTTTKEMLALVLGGLGATVCSEANHNNHIGVPQTLLRILPEHRFAVVEMGVNHFGEMAPLARPARPQAAVITNVGPTHLEAFGSEEGVAREKAIVLDHLAPGGLAVLHADDPWSRGIAERHAGRVATFGLSRGADWRGTQVRQDGDRLRFVVERTGDAVCLPAVGRWQASNALAAIAVAAEMGLEVSEAAALLAAFRPPKWRMELRRAGTLALMLDCYNANPASMLGAVAELGRGSGRRVAVLGDMLELGALAPAAHRRVGRAVAEAGVHLLCAVGEQAETLAREAVEGGLEPHNVFAAPGRAEAARWLCGRLQPADTVLFKASRGVRLEEVADAVIAWAENGDARAQAAAAACP